ncbi:hypothetical protein [Helicobacter pylori]|nr:hypothetical protein [Helicobacter pylori]
MQPDESNNRVYADFIKNIPKNIIENIPKNLPKDLGSLLSQAIKFAT